MAYFRDGEIQSDFAMVSGADQDVWTTGGAVDGAANTVAFIDARVENLQQLLAGLKPGERAFVLDPDQDGLAQIAATLSQHHLSGLSVPSPTSPSGPTEDSGGGCSP